MSPIKVNTGNDKEAAALGSGITGLQGTASAATTTSLTTSGLTASAHVGKLLVAGDGTGPTVYGVVTANTITVFTVDRWYNPNSPTGTAGTTPLATSKFVVLPGAAPAFYMALSTDATAPAAGDTTLPSEITSAGGLTRAPATYAHTTGATTYTLTGTFTATGTGLPVTVQKIGTFDAASSGVMLHETALSASATLSAASDATTCTQTVTM